MVIVFIGPPGSGKGTQAKKLADRLGYFYLSTGQMFRDMQDFRPDLAEIMNKGDLIPDKDVLSLLYEYLEKKKLFDNFIIDGTPRSVYQYEEIQNWLGKRGAEIKWAIFLDISKKEAVRRLSARRQDKVTGKIYNLITNPPRSDVDLKNLVIRDDDKPEVIEERFVEYQKATKPLIEYLDNEEVLVKLNGEEPIEIIFEKILQRLDVKDGEK